MPTALAQDPAEAWTLYSPDPVARLSLGLWQHHAESHFRAALTVLGAKPDERGVLVEECRFEVSLQHLRHPERKSRVEVVTFPLRDAPSLKTHANAAADAIGGAGMDALVAKAQRVWQVVLREGDESGAAVLSAVLALVLLGPVAPRGTLALVGFKGSRERAEAMGWT